MSKEVVDKKEIQDLISNLYRWILKKNMLAKEDNNLPIIFFDDTSHCGYVEFYMRRSLKKYHIEIETDGYYYGYKRKRYQINYNDNCTKEQLKYHKLAIKDFIRAYIKAKREITAYKFMQINKACIDLIDNENVFHKKEENIIVKSIISKEEVVDYKGNVYKINELYSRYL